MCEIGTWFRNQVNQYGYIEFLTKVLKATRKSNAEQVVYQLLVKNTKYLNEDFIEVLRRWANMSLGLSERMQIDEERHVIATDIANFSICILNFPLGDRASNVEIAIAGYEIVLTVFTRDTIPYHWALAQNGLGNAYSNRIRGDKAENLEFAIAAYESALEVFTRDSFADDWAMVQTNLGSAYCQRINGEKAENLELAITAYNAALQVYTQNGFPDKWASVQTNLANAYSDRIRGEMADNLELAIAACKAALEARTRDKFPQAWAQTQYTLGLTYRNRIRGDKADNVELAIAAYNAVLEVITPKDSPQYWAMTQHNLATAYLYRIRGDRTENIELAINTFKAALQVYTPDALPQSWAETQTNLGIAYSERIRGDKAENIEQAIAALSTALKVLTQDKFPEYWATAQNNLGKAYFERIRGDQADNIKKAITAYKNILQVYTREKFPYEWARTQANLAAVYCKISDDKAKNLELAIAANNHALEVYTRDGFPTEWAGVQNNLGNAYYQRIVSDKAENAENIELAIKAFKEALKVRTRDTLPQDWAMTQNNLGNAYSQRIRGDRSENIEQGIAAFTSALEVYTRDTFPENYAQTLFNLGLAYQQAQQFTNAYTTYNSAIETVELLREEIVSGSDTKRKQAEQWNRLYQCMVEVCLARENIAQAIEYAERSKTRNLVELILNRDSKTIFSSDDLNQLEQLRDEIAAGQDKIQNGKAENPQILGQHLQKLRQQRNELQDKYLPVGYGFDFKKFQANLHEDTAIIQWYITSAGCETFIITRSNLQILNTHEQDSLKNKLMGYFQEYFTAYSENRTEWRNSLNSRFTSLSQILQIENILNELSPKSCLRLILIPHVFLHLFPLHTLPLTNGQLLFEQFSNGVSYAPSCQLLQQIQQRKRPNFESIFAIQNPTKDLAYADLEVEQILPLFSFPEVLSKSQATKAELYQAAPKLKDVNYLHFACHGSFNQNSPINSFLLLVNAHVSSVPIDADSEKYLKSSNGRNVDLSKCLTLGNLFERGFDLNQCRLVILSACETGLIDFNNISDEYIGLPSGFLYAGSSCVVSSLWTVDDSSTAYLMMKFLQNLQEAFNSGQDVSVAVALNQAQKWLRDITWEDLEKCKSSLPPDSAKTQTREVRRISSPSENFDPNKPFASPYYWAAFTAIGK